MIGYMQLYIKIVGENDIYYAIFEGNFKKAVRKGTLAKIKKSIKKAAESFGKVYSVEFCSKEEYEENKGVDIGIGEFRC